MPLPAAIAEFMQKYGVASDEVWAVPGGKVYAVKHGALERIAFKHNIVFDPPQIVEADSAKGVATMIVKGRMGEFEQWSVGEASPQNCKNSYTWSMAEKRGKDRVILKLLNLSGELYSEEEADAFQQKAEAETKADDLFISADQHANLLNLVEEASADLARFNKHMGVADLKKLPKAKYDTAIAALNAKKVRHVA